MSTIMAWTMNLELFPKFTIRTTETCADAGSQVPSAMLLMGYSNFLPLSIQQTVYSLVRTYAETAPVFWHFRYLPLFLVQSVIFQQFCMVTVNLKADYSVLYIGLSMCTISPLNHVWNCLINMYM